MSANYKIRPLSEAETPFVLATFLNSWVKNFIAHLRDDAPRWKSVPAVYRCMPTDLICQHYHAAMTRHLREGRCLVAGDESDSVLLAYVVFSLSPNALYWYYSKPDFRGFGIEQDLVSACGFDSERPVFLPYRHSGTVRLLRDSGLRE